MKVVFLSRTPLAGAPYENMKNLKKYAGLDVRWVTLKNYYNDGRVFPKDLMIKENAAESYRIIKAADVIHIQNDAPMGINDPALAGKKMLVQFHTVPMKHNVEEYRRAGCHCYTVDQPWLTREYRDMPSLPNLMDPEENLPKTTKNEKPRLVFAPTNDWNATVLGSRAMREVVKVLDIWRYVLDLDIFMGVEYVENLRRKQAADIMVDDVCNHTFHKTTIEGCCFGLAVLTSFVSEYWTYTDLGTLNDRLNELIKGGKLEEMKAKSRGFVEGPWHPKNQVGRYVEAYKKVMAS